MSKPFSIGNFLMSECQPFNWLLSSITLLGFRIYVSWQFFKSGLTKIQSWDTTIFLFEDEYQVPILPPEIAAYLATAGELILPVLIVIGLMTNLSALGLFILNFVAVISYPYLFTIEGAGGYWQHVAWGAMIWAVFIFGPGRFSIDAWIAGRLQKNT